MIYLSSNKQRKRKIKDVCREYKELPPYIVKQIIDYELSKDKKTNLHRTINEVRVLNERITIYEKAIKTAIKGKKIVGNYHIYEFSVFTDLGNGYCSRMTVSEAINKLNFYKRVKRESIADARYNYIIKKYTKPFQIDE